jgi:[methyl-Co(III) methanol-specific corrinoid protein]:coenzyme M methyltransferase
MREKILELLNGKKINSQPAFSGLIHVTTEGLKSEGLIFHETHKNAQKMARAAASTFKLSGFTIGYVCGSRGFGRGGQLPRKCGV